jgi:hypothetical protein
MRNAQCAHHLAAGGLRTRHRGAVEDEIGSCIAVWSPPNRVVYFSRPHTTCALKLGHLPPSEDTTKERRRNQVLH